MSCGEHGCDGYSRLGGGGLLLIAFAALSCTTILGDDFVLGEGDGGAGAAAGGGGVGGVADGGGGTTPACENGAQDEGESDVDCGGVCPNKCADGLMCGEADDCQSNFCDPADACAPQPCGGMCESWQTCTADVCTPGAIVYVNLDGGSFSYGAEDSASLNIQEVSSEALPGSMQPYGGTEFDKAAVFDPMVDRFAPFNIKLTRLRPDDGVPYQMMVITPSGSGLVPNQKIWVPTPDCGDSDKNNVGFVIFSAQSNTDEGITPQRQGEVASQAIARLMGIEPANGATDIMHHQVSGGGPRSFEDFCHPRPLNQAWACNTQHQARCGQNDDLQNSFAELLALLGPAAR